jgi:hypothetical protein
MDEMVARQRWGGVIGDVPVLWVTWVVDAARRAGLSPDSLRVSVGGIPLRWDTARLTFGDRWYFLCPQCGRRVEAVYSVGGDVGCRACLHLGYRSQTWRGPSWSALDGLLERQMQRWRPSGEAAEALAAELRSHLEEKINDLVAMIRVEEYEDGPQKD